MSTALFPIYQTLTPFLYPFTRAELVKASVYYQRYLTKELGCLSHKRRRKAHTITCAPPDSTRLVSSPPKLVSYTPKRAASDLVAAAAREQESASQYDHLDPQPNDYSASPFLDACTLTLHAGAGGNGCVSFLREKFIAEGPPNGGDGGSGGSIYIQAVRGETSLHKLARKCEVKAGRGKHGQGSSKGGQRGEDVLIEVPIGTVVREIERFDPVAEEERMYIEELRARRRKTPVEETGEEGAVEDDIVPGALRREKWILYPGANAAHILPSSLPDLPKPRRSHLTALQPGNPIKLDLDTPMERPLLLAAGSMGGLGNPHFVSRTHPRPKFATKGDSGMRLMLHFELKLLADVGLVGLPNAGKSTLLRALSRSRTRIGSWAFTTLRPSVGTVVLDDYKSRPRIDAHKLDVNGEQRTRFTIADIPGLIEDAHLNKGLGLDFLRHVERAAVLAFVLDLSAGDAVAALRALWREVAEYEVLKEQQLAADTQRVIDWDPESLMRSSDDADHHHVPEQLYGDIVSKARKLPPLVLPPMTSKPWFVIANKADMPGTEANFKRLKMYLEAVTEGEILHPSGKKNAWRRRVEAVPVSAMRKEGVDGIPELVLDLLDGR